jgi:hypothetical protein
VKPPVAASEPVPVTPTGRRGHDAVGLAGAGADGEVAVLDPADPLAELAGQPGVEVRRRSCSSWKETRTSFEVYMYASRLACRR